MNGQEQKNKKIGIESDSSARFIIIAVLILIPDAQILPNRK